MSPKDVLASLSRMIGNPYLETYRNMPEYELISWKYVFEASLAMGAHTREKAQRLRAIKQVLDDIKAGRMARDGMAEAA